MGKIIKKNKERILSLLKSGTKSATEISETLKINFYRCKNLLSQLEEEGRVKENIVGRYSFWKLGNKSYDKL